jgi:GNAT superfamily N-acetyltransferase
LGTTPTSSMPLHQIKITNTVRLHQTVTVLRVSSMTVEATAPSEPKAVPGDRPCAPAWTVRLATAADVAQVAAAVAELLLELGGTPPDQQAMRATAHTLIEDRDAGTVLVADADAALVGVLAASWQTAIHIPGRYALIQDLWVHPSWRSQQIGAVLVAALLELAGQAGVERIEVGLPRESFAGLAATEAFYQRNGFAPLGPRMRLVP